MPISIGTGSWTDSEYNGVLYPKGLKAADRLAHYSKVFDHVEVNSGYHYTPKLEQVKKWADQTEKNFSFDFKLHQALSRKPSAYQDLVTQTLKVLDPLFTAKKFGTFLLMLSPYFEPDRNRLAELDGIISALKPHSLAVEFRNRAWVEGGLLEETLDYFREKKIVWVTVDMPAVNKPGVMPPVDEVTSPKMAYLRLHGRNRKAYLHAETATEKHHYLYTGSDLKEIVGRIESLAARAKMVRVVANNHAEDFAPRAALELKGLLGQEVPLMEGQAPLFD